MSNRQQQEHLTASEHFAAPERGAHAAETKDGNSLWMRGAAVLGVTVFAGVAAFSFSGGGKKAVQPEKVSINKGAVFEPAPAPVAPVPPPQVLTQARSVPTSATLPGPGEPKAPDMLDAARRAPLTAFKKTGALTDSGARVMGFEQSAQTEDGGQFGKLLTATRTDAARAGHIGNRDFVIAMGTSIPCTLETALSSDQPGFSTCVINRDVLSDNGHVVLLEKGTQVIGEYRGGLKRGQARLFVLWTRAKTPTGVIVALGSPGTDALGRAGFSGEVDNHWWERFGSALLLSVVGDVSAYGTQQLQAGGVQANNTGQAGKQAAAIAVEQGAAMVPTLNKHQGEQVNIMVGRDLDFTAVYRLRMVPPAERGTVWPTPRVAGSADVFSSNIVSLKD